MIYTTPINRFTVKIDASEPPVVESVIWAYSPDHPLSVKLPDQIHDQFASFMIQAANEVNEALLADYESDMAAWKDLPKSMRPAKPTLRTADMPENGWVILDGNWLVDGDPSDSLDIYNMPPRAGWEFVSEEEFNKAHRSWIEREEAELRKARRNEVEFRTKDYDLKAQRYKKLGWDESDIVAEFGPRPSIEDLV